jgi:hypothetical protein
MEIERLESKAYQIAGVSRLAAQSQKPAGLSSGEALRQYRDYQTERFLVAFQSLEDFFVECARQKIELAKRINDKGKGGYSIMAVDRQGKQDVAQVIKWSDVDISEDKYIMRPYPVGFLPSTPAGKVQKAAELVQAFPQLQDQALQLLGGIPDVDAAVSLATSDLDELDQIAGQFLEGKEYIAPEPTMNLRLALRRMQQHLTRATVRGAPENVLQMFRDFITSTIDLLEASAPPQPPQPIAGNEIGG